MSDEQVVAIIAAILVQPYMGEASSYVGAAYEAQDLFDAVRAERKRRYSPSPYENIPIEERGK